MEIIYFILPALSLIVNPSQAMEIKAPTFSVTSLEDKEHYSYKLWQIRAGEFVFLNTPPARPVYYHGEAQHFRVRVNLAAYDSDDLINNQLANLNKIPVPGRSFIASGPVYLDSKSDLNTTDVISVYVTYSLNKDDFNHPGYKSVLLGGAELKFDQEMLIKNVNVMFCGVTRKGLPLVNFKINNDSNIYRPTQLIAHANRLVKSF